eukprot:6592156-Alexandrium_andersonii.AAC.1
MVTAIRGPSWPCPPKKLSLWTGSPNGGGAQGQTRYPKGPERECKSEGLITLRQKCPFVDLESTAVIGRP